MTRKRKVSINLTISFDESQKGVKYGEVSDMEIVEDGLYRIEYIGEDIDPTEGAEEVAECIRRYLICDMNVRNKVKHD